MSNVMLNNSYDGYPSSALLANRIFLNELDDCKKFPKYFQIGTVNYCNAKCIMCPQRAGSLSIKRTHMSDELFNKIVDEISRYVGWVEGVLLYWLGEPCLDRYLISRVHRLHDIGCKRIEISTNAELLDVDMAEQLFRAGAGDIRVSIDGFTKEVYESIRQGLHFDKVVKNVHAMIQLRNKQWSHIPIRLRFVYQKKNMHEWESFKSYWSKYIGQNSKDRICFIQCHTKEEWSLDGNVSRYANVPCIALFSSMIIDSDGAVPLCCMDVSRNCILGNVNEDTIEHIWHSMMLHKIRCLHLHEGRKGYELCAGCDCWAKDWSR